MNKGKGMNMPKWDKLLEKLGNLSSNPTFKELRRILLSFGYEESQPRGEATIIHIAKGTRK